MIEEGAILKIYDPKVKKEIISKDLKERLKNKVEVKNEWIWSNSIEDAAKDADALIILTEWEEFKKINWEELSKIMRKPTWVFDTRSISDIDNAKIMDLMSGV